MGTASSTAERVGKVLKEYAGSGEEFLDLLARVKKALESSEMDRIPPELIEPYPDQPRKYFNAAKIQQMADSIDATAQISAGMVRRLSDKPRSFAKYQLVDGERRWRGVMAIPKERRPLYKAEIIEADNEVVQFLIAGMANFNREGHTPLETAETIRRYHKEFEIPMAAVADLLGISGGWAYNILGLLDLPKPVQKMLDPELEKKSQLPIVAAMHISKLKDPVEQVALAQKVQSGKITVGGVRREVVKIGIKTGNPVAIRNLPARKRWQGRVGKIEAIGRYAADLDAMLASEGISEIMRTRKGETSDLLKQIRAAIGKLNRCESRILKIQQE